MGICPNVNIVAEHSDEKRKSDGQSKEQHCVCWKKCSVPIERGGAYVSSPRIATEHFSAVINALKVSNFRLPLKTQDIGPSFSGAEIERCIISASIGSTPHSNELVAIMALGEIDNALGQSAGKAQNAQNLSLSTFVSSLSAALLILTVGLVIFVLLKDRYKQV